MTAASWLFACDASQESICLFTVLFFAPTKPNSDAGGVPAVESLQAEFLQDQLKNGKFNLQSSRIDN